MSGTLSSERYEIPIRMRSVLRVYVRSSFNLQLAGEGPETSVSIADPLAIVTENDPVGELRTSPQTCFGKVVVCGRDLREEHRLQIIFLPGVWFRVDPERNGESGWGPAGSKGLILVCTPGGQIPIWFGQRRNGNKSAERVPSEICM